VKISTTSAGMWVATLFAAVFLAATAQAATLEGGSFTIRSGEQAKFPIAGAGAPSDLHAQCTLSDVAGSASLVFDGEHYIAMSDLAVGETVTLTRGETREYRLSGVVDAPAGGAYIAFNFTGAAAAMCFPGMACDGAQDGAASVTVSCKPAAN